MASLFFFLNVGAIFLCLRDTRTAQIVKSPIKLSTFIWRSVLAHKGMNAVVERFRDKEAV